MKKVINKRLKKKLNKVVVKEFDRTLVGIDIMLYVVYVTLGFIILNFPQIEALKAIEYAAPLFFMFAFFSLVAYFLNRRPKDYEFLFLGLINVVAGTFILINEFYPDTALILGNAVLVCSIATALNKGYRAKILLEERDLNAYPKIAITVLLMILGILVVGTLHKIIDMGSIILGYYFMIFGLLSMLEPLLLIIIKNPTLESYLVNLIESDYDEPKWKRKIRLHSVKNKKLKKKIK